VVTCANCGAENPAGKRFCGDCGTPLEAGCPNCGAENPPGKRFCGDCGAPLVDASPAPAAAAAPSVVAIETPVAERRLVSVLFADLVGFTELSGARDAEEVRELLSRYFETCRRLVELYGGTVEKFIGDAVMAVWGTPVATEDDAERAVRAALDLVAAVSALGDEIGTPELRARAGVLTGEAAVTVGAAGEGMVAGDLVNTASRVQSVAEPGSVYVGEATRRATEQAVVYEDAGRFELKGKEGETPLWRALRVVSGVRGQLKSEGLEAPFVGRDRELRQIKELFHSCAEEGRAQLVSVTGIAGIGKSRLAWEFYKYIDGLPQTTYWHRGRCLAYGEGVTYWALADMVRMRCRIAEDDEPDVGLQKLRTALEEHVLDAEERRFVEPRLAQLLGFGDHETRERQDLFAAWRLFFERLAETYPTVLAFEDMQWADSALLDFVEHLLEWSRNHPLFVTTAARPELLERRPTWGAGHRHFTSLYLEPLSERAMEDLLTGLVPGLPVSLRSRILTRAEGVPLYAVETVRMLLDRGLLVEEGASYRVVGEVESLDVPETLHALVAARLDGLPAEERRLLGDASVLGKTFTPDALSELTGIDRHRLEGLLTGLVRREVLGLQSDPRSPEQGQYGFLQDLLRHVAYETLPRRDRRAKHLAAAEYLSSALADDEVVEVIASHLLDAYRLDPEAADADALKARAQAALLRAGERAASLGASAEAQRYFEHAGELATAPAEQAAALSRAGQMALALLSTERALELFERAVALHDSLGDTHAAARASAWLAYAEERAGRAHDAVERMERAYATIADDEGDADLAFLLARLGAAHWFAGNVERAAERTEQALDLAEALRLPDLLAAGWNSKAIVASRRRPQEARALFQLSVDTALEHGLHRQAGISSANLSDLALRVDRYEESIKSLERVVGLGRRIGDRHLEGFALSDMSYALTLLGRWDEALARFAEIPDEQVGPHAQLVSVLSGILELQLHRGRVDEARQLLARYENVGRSGDVEARGVYNAALAAVRLAEGDARGALAAADEALAGRATVGVASQQVKVALPHALEAALVLDERERAEELLGVVEALPPGLRPPYLVATARRFRARLAADPGAADDHFVAAAGELRALGASFQLAVVQLEHGERLLGDARADEAQPLLAEARETFERLQAAPWLGRLDELAAGERTRIPV
jgi:class 3 adenylate cyclase/tetratricopeptide (TPR) repeat protein